MTINIGSRDSLRRAKRGTPQAAWFTSQEVVRSKATSILVQLDEARRYWTFEGIDGSPRIEGQDPGDIHGKVSAFFHVYHESYKVGNQGAVVTFDRETGKVLWVALMGPASVDPPVIRLSPGEAGARIKALASENGLYTGNGTQQLRDALDKIKWHRALKLQYWIDNKNYPQPRTRLCYVFASLGVIVYVDAETGSIVSSGRIKQAILPNIGALDASVPVVAKIYSPVAPQATTRSESLKSSPAPFVLGISVGFVLVSFVGVAWWVRRS